jgi:hypothetical protein
MLSKEQYFGSEIFSNIKYSATVNNVQLCYTVFDSSTKIPEGVLMGNTVHLGNFKECLQVNVNEDWGSFKGQHCMANVKINMAGIIKEVWCSSVALYPVIWKQTLCS